MEGLFSQDKLMSDFSVHAIRSQFPFFSNSSCVYLDNGATTQKPKRVIQTISRFYEAENTNIHRGIYALSELASSRYEAVRQATSYYLGGHSADEVVFVKGTTEGLNLIAQSYGRAHLKAGDEILLSTLEHHSNIIPWQLLAEEKGLIIKAIPLKASEELDVDAYAKLLSPKTKIVALNHVSNVLGSIQPIKHMAAMAKTYGALVVVDGAQALPHLRVDVKDLGCDFYVFSGHKAFGPTGIGAIWGKTHIWATLLPYQGGGNMVQKVSFERSTYKTYPDLFEAGTPPIASVLGLGAAIEFLRTLDFQAVHSYETQLHAYAQDAMQSLKGLRILGRMQDKIGILSFTLEGMHPHDIAQVLAKDDIAIRAGHHCAQPLLQALGIQAASRVSLALYNTREEVDALILSLHKAQKLLG